MVSVADRISRIEEMLSISGKLGNGALVPQVEELQQMQWSPIMEL